METIVHDAKVAADAVRPNQQGKHGAWIQIQKQFEISCNHFVRFLLLLPRQLIQ